MADKRDEAVAVLKELVNDINAMRAGSDHEEDDQWFVHFMEGYYNSDWDHYGVCWPNLAITVDKAKKLLKDLENRPEG